MNLRNKNAKIIQGGASNRGLVARKLVEAIQECHAEGVSVDDDPAVFLICHQLTFLLTGHDFCVGCGDRLSDRWVQATQLIEED